MYDKLSSINEKSRQSKKIAGQFIKKKAFFKKSNAIETGVKQTLLAYAMKGMSEDDKDWLMKNKECSVDILGRFMVKKNEKPTILNDDSAKKFFPEINIVEQNHRNTTSQDSNSLRRSKKYNQNNSVPIIKSHFKFGLYNTPKKSISPKRSEPEDFSQNLNIEEVRNETTLDFEKNFKQKLFNKKLQGNIKTIGTNNENTLSETHKTIEFDDPANKSFIYDQKTKKSMTFKNRKDFEEKNNKFGRTNLSYNDLRKTKPFIAKQVFMKNTPVKSPGISMSKTK